jgi:hypothetical protein
MRVMIILGCVLLLITSANAQVEPISKAHSFALGINTPHQPDYFRDKWSHGIMLHAGMSWLLLPYFRVDITAQANVFSYLNEQTYGGGIMLIDIGGEANLHLLPVNWRVSPFLLAGAAPAFTRFGEIVNKGDIDPNDPYGSEPSFFMDFGWTTKYGAGVSVLLGQETHAWITWREHCYRSFSHENDRLAFRTVMVGIFYFLD